MMPFKILILQLIKGKMPETAIIFWACRPWQPNKKEESQIHTCEDIAQSLRTGITV